MRARYAVSGVGRIQLSLGEVGELQPRLPGQRVRPADDHAHRLGVARLEVQPLAVEVAGEPPDDEVDRAARELRQERGERALLHLDGDPRVAALEQRQRLRHQHRCDDQQRAHDDPPGGAVADRRELGAGVVERAQHQPRVADEARPVRGRGEAARGAQEELELERRLEVAQEPGRRRLGHVQRGRRLVQALVLVDRRQQQHVAHLQPRAQEPVGRQRFGHRRAWRSGGGDKGDAEIGISLPQFLIMMRAGDAPRLAPPTRPRSDATTRPAARQRRPAAREAPRRPRRRKERRAAGPRNPSNRRNTCATSPGRPAPPSCWPSPLRTRRTSRSRFTTSCRRARRRTRCSSSPGATESPRTRAAR